MMDGMWISARAPYSATAEPLNHSFAEDQLPYSKKKERLSLLVETYLKTMRDIGVETWIMHGTLLGWWWNKKVRSGGESFLEASDRLG